MVIIKMPLDGIHLRRTPRGATLAALLVQCLPPRDAEITQGEPHVLLQLDVGASFAPYFGEVGVNGSRFVEIFDCRGRAEQQVNHL